MIPTSCPRISPLAIVLTADKRPPQKKTSNPDTFFATLPQGFPYGSGLTFQRRSCIFEDHPTFVPIKGVRDGPAETECVSVGGWGSLSRVVVRRWDFGGPATKVRSATVSSNLVILLLPHAPIIMAKSLKNLPTLTMGDFAELKGSIEASKGRNSGPQIGTFTPKSAVSEADLRDLTARVDELFANEEWEDCERRYRRLVNELKLGPVKNQGRFALTLAHLQKYEEAVELAVKTYKELPSESASYEALALCTRENKDLLQTGLWSRLADLAASHPSLSLQELSVSATRELEMCTYWLIMKHWRLESRRAQKF